MFSEQIEKGSWTFKEILAIRKDIMSLNDVLRIVLLNRFA